MMCSFLLHKPVRPPVQIIPKQFPDGSQYYVFYSIPDYFPSDIHFYKRGEVLKVFVYQEREMDLIFRTTDSIEDIIQYFKTESEKNNWKIERMAADPLAEHQIITLPLIYNNHSVETLQYSAYRGYIFTASRGNRVMVCRIIQVTDTPFTLIVQQIRTKL
ncbi:hypothetical protein AMJ80_05455 [bacterium SM23_31]|nr:MAG: hypothetical protein AMJ80_05455 [bacterium SM23_31]